MSVNSLIRTALASSVGVLLATFLAACGGGDAGPQSRLFDLEIKQGAVDLESGVISVKQGDNVTVNFRADEEGLIHLHGYDIEQQVGPGAPTTFEFAANATGRYNFTFHGGGTDHGDAGDSDEHGALFESDTLEQGDTFEFEVPGDMPETSIPFHNHMSHDVTGHIVVKEGSGAAGTVNIEVISEGGFAPLTVNVQPGAKVVWTNTGSERARVTSGNPPTADEEDHEEQEGDHEEQGDEEEETVLGALEVRPR